MSFIIKLFEKITKNIDDSTKNISSGFSFIIPDAEIDFDDIKDDDKNELSLDNNYQDKAPDEFSQLTPEGSDDDTEGSDDDTDGNSDSKIDGSVSDPNNNKALSIDKQNEKDKQDIQEIMNFNPEKNIIPTNKEIQSSKNIIKEIRDDIQNTTTNLGKKSSRIAKKMEQAKEEEEKKQLEEERKRIEEEKRKAEELERKMNTLNAKDMTDDQITQIISLLNANKIGRGMSVGTAFSNNLLDFIDNALPRLEIQPNKDSSEYNQDLIQQMNKLFNISVEDLREAGSSCRDAPHISEIQQFSDVWGEPTNTYLKGMKDNDGNINERYGCCYLCGLDFECKNIASEEKQICDYEEMEHKIPANEAFTMLHYRFLKNISICGTSAYKIWHDNYTKYDNHNEDNIWKLYEALNCSKDNKNYVDNVNNAFEKVFEGFEKYINEEYNCNSSTEEDFDKKITIITGLLTYWLSEFAYAHHLCNQAKGGLSLHNKSQIKTFVSHVKSRTNKLDTSDIKTITENKIHDNPSILDTLNNENTKNNILAKMTYVKNIRDFFHKNVYKLISNLDDTSVENIKKVLLMKQLRNILLYSDGCISNTDKAKQNEENKKIQELNNLKKKLEDIRGIIITLNNQLSETRSPRIISQLEDEMRKYTLTEGELVDKIKDTPASSEDVNNEINDTIININNSINDLTNDLNEANNINNDSDKLPDGINSLSLNDTTRVSRTKKGGSRKKVKKNKKITKRRKRKTKQTKKQKRRKRRTIRKRHKKKGQ
jgi:hypothetical protein